jgi:predicted DNA-binding WGR domain protein
MKTFLTRSVKDKERYYSIDVSPSLFGGYLVVRVWGANRYKRPSGQIEECYDDYDRAIVRAVELRQEKEKRGYREASIHDEAVTAAT